MGIGDISLDAWALILAVAVVIVGLVAYVIRSEGKSREHYKQIDSSQKAIKESLVEAKSVLQEVFENMRELNNNMKLHASSETKDHERLIENFKELGQFLRDTNERSERRHSELMIAFKEFRAEINNRK